MCFDQILRPLLYALLGPGGMPPNVLRAYSTYLETLVIRNSVAQSIGEPHKHICGIPQGCPLSMLMMAFMMRPWIIMVRTPTVHPRVLADDILVTADGPQHEQHFQQALDTTHCYLWDMGALAAPDKSANFPTSAVTRSRLRNQRGHHLVGGNHPHRGSLPHQMRRRRR